MLELNYYEIAKLFKQKLYQIYKISLRTLQQQQQQSLES
jgi:hypothetical protein